VRETRWVRRSLLLAALILLALSVCRLHARQTVNGSEGLTAEQRRRADQIISIFENDTPKIQYGYAEALKDGRGLTAGRAGFTSATHDLLRVVQRYVAKAPGSALAKYLPRLKQLAREGSASVRGLEGLNRAWRKAAGDPRFCAVQDAVVDQEYYRPAVAHWRKLGLHTALSLTILYDTVIQHGDDADPDGLPAILARTRKRIAGAPTDTEAEKAWLLVFLKVRRETLANAHEPSTRKAWAETVRRCDVLHRLVTDGNVDLKGPIVLRVYGKRFVLP
jgi:chitosanase